MTPVTTPIKRRAVRDSCYSTFPKIVVHDVLIGLSQRFVAGHATAAADSWGIRRTKARIMMQNDVDMFLSSRNQKFDVVL